MAEPDFSAWGVSPESLGTARTKPAKTVQTGAPDFSAWGVTAGDLEPVVSQAPMPRSWGQVAGDVGAGLDQGLSDVLGSAASYTLRGLAGGADALGFDPNGLNRARAHADLVRRLQSNSFEREHGSGWGQAGRIGGQVVGTLPISMAAGPVVGGVLGGLGRVAGAPAVGNTLARIVMGVAGSPQARILPTGAIAETAGSTLGRIGSLATRGAIEGGATAPFLPPEQDVTATLPMSRSEMLAAPIADNLGERIATGAALGGVAGPLAQGIANGAKGALRAALGGVGDQEGAALARLARERYGIEIEPGQLAGNKMVRYANEVSAAMPFSGGTAARQQQRAALNRAITHTFGEQSDTISPEVIQAAKDRLGSQFDSTIQQIGGIRGDVRMLDEFDDLLDDATRELTPEQIVPLKKTVMNIVGKFHSSDPASPAPNLTPEAFKALTDYNTALGRNIRNPNPGISFYAGKIKDILMGSAERTATDPAAVEALQATRNQWRNMLRVSRTADPATGQISVPKLANLLAKNGELLPFQASDDLSNLARIGSRFMRGMPESGTAERNLMQQTFGRLGQTVGPSIIPGIGLGGMSAAAGAGAMGAIGPLAAAGGIVGVPLAARGVRLAINGPWSRAMMERAPAVLSAPVESAFDAGSTAIRRGLPMAVQPSSPRRPLQIEIVGDPANAPGFVDVRTRRLIPQAQGAR